MDKNSPWRARFERVLRAALAHAEPKIIIWGPGQHHVDYEKRRRIKEAIRNEVPYGEVNFPEDPEMDDADSGIIRDGDLDAAELLQAVAADIVIALDASKSVAEEIARYSTNPKIAAKLFVVAPAERRPSYHDAILEKLMVYFVSDEEWVTCHETTKLCLIHVRTWCVDDYAKHSN